MKDKIRGGVMASFMGDALSLGVHWIYNTRVIDKKYGRVESILKPELAKYHAGKQKGEFTHYGDQMMVLLKSVVEKSGFELDHFSTGWQALFRQYPGYLDHATTETLANFKAGKPPRESGSPSSDLGGAARIAPLLLHYADRPAAFSSAARAQTAMTHNHPGVMACAEIFSKTACEVVSGTSPVAAIERALESTSTEQTLADGIQTGLDSRALDTRQAVADFGQMCEVDAALPATMHLIAKFEDDANEALVENIMAGGDSAARGMLTGFILGCYQGSGWIPKEWIDDLVAYDDIVAMIDRAL